MVRTKIGKHRQMAKNIIYPALEEGLQQGLVGQKLRRFVSKKWPGERCKYGYRTFKDELAKAMVGYQFRCRQLRLDV